MKKNTKFAIYLGILTFFGYIFFQFPGFQGYEDETYNQIVKNLAGGEFKTARSGYAQTLLETPFVWKGQFWDNVLGVQHDKLAQLSALFYNPFITAATVVLMFLIFSLFTNRRKSFWLSLVYSFGTMAFPYASIGMEPTAVLFVLLAVYFLFRFGKFQNNRDLTLSGLFYFLLFFSKAYYFITLPAFIGYLLAIYDFRFTKKFSQDCLRFFLPLVVILPVYFLSNKYNFGVYFGGQYNLANELAGGERMLFGTYGLLLSFGKSLFIYVPALILAAAFFSRFFQKFRQEAVFALVYCILLVLFVAQIHWWSDETWGPRYLLSLSAIGLLPLVMIEKADFLSKTKNVLITGIVTLSLLFQLLGVLVRYDVFPYSFYDIYQKTGYNILASQEYQYIPQFAPYFVNFTYIKNRITGQKTPLHYKIIYTPPMEQVGGAGTNPVKEITYDTGKYRNHALNFWWMNLPGISAYKMLAVFVLIFAALIWWGRKLLRQTQRRVRL